MRQIRRLLAGFLLLLGLFGGGAYLWLQASLPALDGRLRLSGLGASVEVVRDRNGVPHIYAASRADALFGLGFVHAQDRLWQMEMTRRLGAGRLAEVLGPRAVASDRLMRAFDFYRLSQSSYDVLGAEERRLIDAYVAGVNAQLSESGQLLPPEFTLLRHAPEPWTAADSLLWIKLMALDLASNWRQELFRLRLAQRLDVRQMAEFYRPYDADAPRGPLALAGLIEAHAGTRLPASPLLDPPLDGLGSNNWAVGPARSASGKPLLANDPHLALRTPSVWYFAHLSWPGHNVIGATLPGLPAVVLGRNDRIAWSFANTNSDVQDVYIERPAAGLPDSYETPEGARPFESRVETIRVAGGSDVTLRLRRTRHGPVLNDALPELDELGDGGELLALAWTALRADDATPQAGLRLEVARNWSEFLAALRDFHGPQQNVIYADVDGNIGFIAPALVPVRGPANTSQGYMPAAGWMAENDWTGFVPFDALPRHFNPADGMLFSANHKIVPDDYPYHLSFEWAPGFRARRIAELLREWPRHSQDSFMAMQRDELSLSAREFLPILLRAEPDSELGAKTRAMIAAWDGAMSRNQPEPLIFMAWYRELARLVYADELGPLFERAWGGRSRFLLYVLGGDGGAWCDDIGTEARETCQELLSRSLARAVDWLAARYGNEPERWRWGEAHQARGRHLPFSDIPVLNWLFETGAPTPGGYDTLNVGVPALSYTASPFANVHAPSMRAIYDLSDPDRSVYIHSTGQSGHPLSPHYRDFVDTWADGGYVPMTTRREDIEIGAVGTLILEPRP
jgi:penicillin amidase